MMVVVVAVIGLLIFNNQAEAPAQTVTNADNSTATASNSSADEFAQCLADAGAVFYGAFWCPHCQEQKALFENSKKLPYVECSLEDGNGQTQVCIDEKITGYPTWKFTDGTELSGVQQFDKLAEKTGCVIQ
ncbi:MAG: hypothetical protein RLZZ230_47 [Candidatus Parcubacteria bacterium]|jgi:thiol-disulfide isomerase/thioredoxin